MSESPSDEESGGSGQPAAAQPLDFGLVLDAAEGFGQPHQATLHELIQHGQITKKRFCMSFIRNFALLNERKEVDTRENQLSLLNVTAARLDELTEKLKSSIDEKIKKLGMRLIRMDNGVQSQEWMVLISEHKHTDALGAASHLSADEQFLLMSWVDQMVTENGSVRYGAALQKARDLPKPMTMANAQELIDKIVAGGIFLLDGDDITLTPRATEEMAPLLTARYKLPRCVCQRVAFRSNRCVSCEHCETRMHPLCWTKWAQRDNNDTTKCPVVSCSKELNKKEMEAQIKDVLEAAKAAEAISNRERCRAAETAQRRKEKRMSDELTKRAKSSRIRATQQKPREEDELSELSFGPDEVLGKEVPSSDEEPSTQRNIRQRVIVSSDEEDD